MDKSIKYYIPEISEFRVGFEFQSRGITKETENTWIVQVWNFQYTKENLELLIMNNQIRVPYLSKEDIEGERFINDNMRCKTPLNFSGFNKEHTLMIDLNIYKSYARRELLDIPHLSIYRIDTNKKDALFNHKEYKFSYNEKKVIQYLSTLFDGNIKNKLELKTILNQINIKKEETK